VNEENARRFSNLWRHPVSSAPGLDFSRMIDAAQADEIKFLYSIGGNPFEVISDRTLVTTAIARVAFRVHQDIVLDSSMLIDPHEAVLLLPGQTRYEQLTGGTSTSSERRVRFTPEIAGKRLVESLPEWEIPTLIGRKTMSNGELLFPFNDTQSIREEMARVMPIYHGIEKLNKAGDQLQWGGAYLYRNGFSNMPNHRARFTVLEPQAHAQQPAGFVSQPGARNSSAGRPSASPIV
jgi:predicted molibdopterin-dependent oxidoreductase YjgC